MAWGDVWNAITGIFGGVGGGTAAQPVQPINPDTSAGQPPTLSTPGGPVGGSGIGGTAPAPGTPAPSAAPLAAGQLPASVDVPGLGQIKLPQQTILDNPWLHGLLGLYAGYAGSPRLQGLGGAIRSGITGGMSAYDTARAAQLTPYKTLAELEKSGAETQLARAHTREADVKAAAQAGIGQYNQGIAAAMKAHADSLADNDPDKPVWEQAAAAAAKNVTKPLDMKEAFGVTTQLAQQRRLDAQAELDRQRAITEGPKRTELTARAGREEQEALTQPAVRQELGARATKEYQEGLSEPSKRIMNTANANLAQGRLGALAQTTANATAEAVARIQKENDPAARQALIAKAEDDKGKEYDASQGIWKHSPWESPTAYRQDRDKYVHDTLAAGGLIYNPKTRKYNEPPAPTIPPANLGVTGGGFTPPPGAPALPGPGWKYDPTDPMHYSFDPSGVRHYHP